jgi:hypothetical protein
MNPTTVAVALPYVNWIVLVAAAVGAFAFAAWSGLTTDATRGYLRFTAITAAVLAALAWASDAALPDPSALVIRAAPAELDALRRAALLGFAVSAIAFAFSLGRPRAKLVTAGAGLTTAALTLVSAAVAWAPTGADAVPLAVQLTTLAVITGGAIASIALGHWYLVTPKLSVGPLVGQTRLLLAALIVQALLFVVWATLGGGVNQGAWDAFTGAGALLVILRGVITIAFPLVLVYMGYRTALTRSMESSTGLLYINLAAVLAGTIGAAALYVSNGTLI